MTCSACDASHHLECIDRLLIGRRTCDCDTCGQIRADAETEKYEEEKEENDTLV